MGGLSTSSQESYTMSHPSWAQRSLAFLHDAARCLALVHQDELHLRPSGELSKSSLAVLAQQAHTKPMSSPPRSERASPGYSLLFRILGHAGLIGTDGRRVLLSATAYEWLDQPPELQVLQLRWTWFQAPEAGWYWLAGGSRQRNLDVQLRYITLETVKAVAGLSTTAWTSKPELVSDLQASGTLDSGCVARNLPRVRHAMERRRRRMLEFLLCEILPCLGLVELQAGEGDMYLRPTSEGVSWLGAALSKRHHLAHPPDDTAVELSAPSHALHFPHGEEPPVTVDDDLRLWYSPHTHRVEYNRHSSEYPRVWGGYYENETST
jgi:hypothetical protein